jgi:competence protein ComEC
MIPRIPAGGTAVVLVLLAVLAPGCTDYSMPAPCRSSYYGDNAGNLTIDFIDVGQGDAALILADGNAVLVDAGPPDAGAAVVSDLKRHGVTGIRLLVATHPHSDHIGGMDEVFREFPVALVWDTGDPTPSPEYESFLTQVGNRHVPYRVVSAGTEYEIEPGCIIRVLSPEDSDLPDDLNEGSLVLLIEYGRFRALMMGDAGIPAEDRLLGSGAPLAAQVLKAGHHGSPHSTGDEFVSWVMPEVAVIPVGAGNDYGHPSPDVVRRLEWFGATVFRTDRDGTVTIRSDGFRYNVSTGTAGAWICDANQSQPARDLVNSILTYARSAA